MKIDIVELREARGWTQAEFARRLGWTRQRLSNYEGNEARRAGLTKLEEFSEALGVTLLELLGDQEALKKRLHELREADEKSEEIKKKSAVPKVDYDLYIEAALVSSKLAQENKIPHEKRHLIARLGAEDAVRRGHKKITEHLLLHLYESQE